MANQSKFVTDRDVDDPLVQDANYRFDEDDRQYIDNQIRGIQQHLVGMYENPQMLTKIVSGNTDVVLTAAEAAHARLKFIGTLMGNITVFVEPGVFGSWTRTFWNATTGAFTLTIKATTGGAGIVVASNAKAVLFSDGVDVFATT